MRMYIRLIRVLLSHVFRHEPFDGISALSFRIMPWDCVVRLAGNDRYHAFMDLGRIDLLLNAGVWPRYSHAFVCTDYIRHRYPLPLFRRLILTTRFVHADKYFFWLEHVFECGGRIIATAISKNGLVAEGKLVPTNTAYPRPMPEQSLAYTAREILIVRTMDGFLKAIQGRARNKFNQKRWDRT
jgi:hypothetical protein